ncbi:MAG: GNAT family N-acetyltransferase, partial [Lachnospiraceae bacterium]|nr:GNAT family N-acetyltransferase [Lachnospiraceae bacterium]
LSDDKYLKLGVIDDNDEPASVCVTGVNENMGSIQWLFTDPDKREQGAGTFLMNGLAELGAAAGLEGLMANYSAQAEDVDDFLTDSGFLVGTDEQIYRVPISEIIYSGEMDAILERRSGNNTYDLKDPKGQEFLKDLIKAHKLDVRMFEGVKAEFCSIYEDPKTKQISAIFGSRFNENDLYVNYLISDKTVQGLCEVLGHLYDKITEEEITRGDFVFSDRVGNALALIQKMFNINNLDEMVEPGRMQAIRLFA